MEPLTDWDAAYDNLAAVPGSAEISARWAVEAATYHAQHPPEVHTYGAGARQSYHLFRPEELPRGLAVFVHGGYWRRFDPSWFSHLAAGAVGRGWAVALPGYTLCPEASITQISREVSAAIAHGAGLVPGPLRLAGHSAGGHLVTRAIC
ncbi:MAG: alpha/beta hydrolase, partial [Pseudomonadota bacterium]